MIGLGSLMIGPSVDYYLGEIRLFAGLVSSQPPIGWLFCNGQTLSISSYPLLFNLLGTTYGGDGTSNYILPDLRGRTPIGIGQYASGDATYARGNTGGSESVVLSANNQPSHAHNIQAANTT